MRIDFEKEMARFLPATIVTESIENSSFWEYLTNTVIEACDQVIGELTDDKKKTIFKM